MQDDLRSRGLPLVLEGSVRRRGLLGRTSAVLAGTAAAICGIALTERALEGFAAQASDHELAGGELHAVDLTGGWMFLLSAAAILVLAAPLLTWCVALLLPRMPPRWRTILGGVAIAAVLLIPVAIGANDAVPALFRAGLVVVVLAAAYWGVGTMLLWAARRSLRELSTLGPMVSRVLPLLMLTVLFFFFNAEIWQVANKLEMSRTWGGGRRAHGPGRAAHRRQRAR